MNEQAMRFGKTENLIGILTEPSVSRKKEDLPALIILNSGVIHRIGQHRLSVKIARDFSRLGHYAFRFDFSGIGDSLSHNDNYEISERWVKEAQAAMDLIEQKRNISKFILLGNCSGALFSFLTAQIDRRIVGAVLINFPGHKTLLRYYFKLAASNPKWWARAVSGSLNFRLVFWQLSNYFTKTKQSKGAAYFDSEKIIENLTTIIKRGTQTLLIYSEWDPGLTYFNAYIKKRIFKYQSAGNLKIEIMAGIDHEFSLLRGQVDLVEIVRNWVTSLSFVGPTDLNETFVRSKQGKTAIARD